MQRAFNVMAIHESNLNVGVTLQVEVNSYMKENKVINRLLILVDESSEVRKLCTKAFFSEIF